MTRSDEDIKQDVIASLYWDSRVDAARVGVFVDDGHVTLTGKVPTYRSWCAARDDAMVIGGVTRVDNRVEIEISAELEAPSDHELHEALVEVLTTDPDLVAADLEVTVQDGHVVLEGTVPTFWERELARIVAARLPGIRGLSNEVVVVPEGDHEDVDIAHEVMAALRRNRHVRLSDLDVAVAGGHVTLAGQVPDEAVRSEVLAAARHTLGVVGITDNLRIRGSAPPQP